jgi:hypothetical protein
LRRGDVEQVAGGFGNDHVRADRLAQLRDEVLEGGDCGLRGLLAPEQVDESIRRDNPAGIESEDRQDGALLLSSELDRSPAPRDLEVPQQPKAQIVGRRARPPLFMDAAKRREALGQTRVDSSMSLKRSVSGALGAAVIGPNSVTPQPA